MHQASVEQAIAPLVEALRADGADAEVTGVDDGTVGIRLVLDDASCAECVMPGDVLGPLFLDALVSSGEPVERVRVADPREAAHDRP